MNELRRYGLRFLCVFLFYGTAWERQVHRDIAVLGGSERDMWLVLIRPHAAQDMKATRHLHVKIFG